MLPAVTRDLVAGVVVGKVIGPVNYDLLTGTIERVLIGEGIESVKTGETNSGA